LKRDGFFKALAALFDNYSLRVISIYFSVTSGLLGVPPLDKVIALFLKLTSRKK
jgi:hypothetical protein